MWLCDLENALGKVITFLGADACAVCVESIKPCADGGIAFALSDGGYVKWFPDGEIVRRGKDDWRISHRPTPRIQNTIGVGGQMVKAMIAQYEKEMGK